MEKQFSSVSGKILSSQISTYKHSQLLGTIFTYSHNKSSEVFLVA